VLLAPVAAAIALAAAMGMAAFEVDLPGYKFGWRQAVSSVAALAVVVGVLPLLGGVVDGRWHVASGDLNPSLGLVLAQDHDVPARVLWVGDPDVVPIDGYHLDDRLSYGTTDGLPTIADRWGGSARHPSDLLGQALKLAAQRRTSRLGALLAPMGVRYIVVPNSDVPAAFSGISRPAPASFVNALSEQLDLSQVASDPSMLVYRNTAWTGMVTSQAAAPRGSTFLDVLATDTTAAPPVLTDRTGPTSWRGKLDHPGSVLLAEASSGNWRLTVDSKVAPRTKAFGWADQFAVASPGEATLTHRTPVIYEVLCGAQVLVWIIAFALLRLSSPTRRRRRRSTAGENDDPSPDEPITSASTGAIA
jgi:hypothetical protein